MREFAEQEVILPDGPYEGRRYRVHRQPFAALWFDAVASGVWNRVVTTGPSQTGKTLLAFVIPLLYHLFEIGENAICGLPSMDIASDKWQEDILPAIESSRFREYLPKRGAGSQGGTPDAIRFSNGPTLKFMSGGGSDKKRAAFTSRVLVVTETDGMDEQGGNSRESDKITQMETRTNAYGSHRRIYMECTVSIEEGRTWREIKAGTDSRIVLLCPHCGLHVSPEREHLQGWQDAEDVIEAREGAAFFCPECGAAWDESQRAEANRHAKLVHRGQEITPTGEVIGALPRTDTLGFRWSAVNNLFVPASDIGAKEWKAQRAEDEENAEKELRQFWWAIPHEPEVVDLSDVTAPAITRQVLSDHGQGFVPDWAERITVGVDIGRWLIHWVAVAWRLDGTAHIFDYGRHEVASDAMAEKRAIYLSLKELHESFESGWQVSGRPDGEVKRPDQGWIDAGYTGQDGGENVVYEFCREAGQFYRPAKGLGVTQYDHGRYRQPKTTGSVVVHIGNNYHLVQMEGSPVPLVEVNSDAWKTFTHQRLSTPADQPGTMTLYEARPTEHMSIAKHLSSEKQVEIFDPKKGTLIRWERVHKNNHWFDTSYLACAAAHYVGVNLLTSNKPRPAKPKNPRRALRMPDGRPFLVTQR